MKHIIMNIYTTKSLNQRTIATSFLQGLAVHGFNLEKIGLFEPLRQDYSLEQAVDFWVLDEDGRNAGGMLGKSSKPRFYFDVQWFDRPDQVNLNWITLSIAVNAFPKFCDRIIKLFEYVVTLVDASYGYMSHWDIFIRQHVTGTLKTRMPGVFWCNYYGPLYVDFFKKENILSFPWVRVKELSGGLVTFLSDNPIALLESTTLENEAKAHLGKDSFGDVEKYRENPTEIQLKNVPNPIKSTKLTSSASLDSPGLMTKLMHH